MSAGFGEQKGFNGRCTYIYQREKKKAVVLEMASIVGEANVCVVCACSDRASRAFGEVSNPAPAGRSAHRAEGGYCFI